MYIRYKTIVIDPDGQRKYLGMYSSSERIAASLTKAGVTAGWQVEIELHPYAQKPHQLMPGSMRRTMNGKPVKRAAEK